MFIGDSFIPSPKERLVDLYQVRYSNQKHKNSEGILKITVASQEIYG